VAKKLSIGVLIEAHDRASKVLASVGKRARSALHTIGSLGTSVAKVGGYATAAVGAVGALGVKFLNDYTERAGEIKDFGSQIGWSAEALQSWGYAARMAGVDGAKFQASLTVLNKNLGGLQTKSGTLYKFLSGAAPDLLKQLESVKNPTEAFDLLVRALERVPDPARRALLAQAAFGKSGAVIARLASEGSEGLSKLRQEAYDLGVVLSQDDVDAAEAFGDNLDRLKLGILGVGNEVFRSLVPGLDKGASGIVEWIKENRVFLGQKIADVVRDIGEAFSDVYDWLSANGPGIWQTVKDGAGFIGDLINGIGQVVDAIGGWGVALDLVIAGLGVAGGPIGMIVAGVVLIAKHWEDIVGWIDKATDAALDYLGVVNPKEEMARRAALTAKQTPEEMKADIWAGKLEQAKRLYGPNGTGEIGARIPGLSADLEYAKLAARKLQEGGGMFRTEGDAATESARAAKLEFISQEVADSSEAINRFAAALGVAPKGEITVNFQNVPQGFQLEPPRSTGPLRITAKVGRRMVAAEGGAH